MLKEKKMLSKYLKNPYLKKITYILSITLFCLLIMGTVYSANSTKLSVSAGDISSSSILKITTKLTSNNVPVPYKQIKLRINNKNYYKTTNKEGKATFIIKKLKKSAYTTQITYTGDTNYKSTSKTIKVYHKYTLIGKNSRGKVYRYKPYGNLYSTKTIALIIGVHPLEYQAHNQMLNAVKKNTKNLKYKYIIYRVVVTKNKNNYAKGRMNGQLLAQKYIVPRIKKTKYNLVVDVHGHRGNGDYRGKRKFIFAPLKDTRSKKLGYIIAKNDKQLQYFSPASQTSPKYVTIPIARSGKRTLLLEMYNKVKARTAYSYSLNFLKTLNKINI